MASYLDKYRTGPIYWLVYYHRGEIRVARGYPHGGYPYNKGTFTLVDTNRWLTSIPYDTMTLSSNGRVLVRREEDIPVAKDMITKYYKSKLDTIKHQKEVAISNIERL